jgi:chorismate mutase-like protein
VRRLDADFRTSKLRLMKAINACAAKASGAALESRNAKHPPVPGPGLMKHWAVPLVFALAGCTGPSGQLQSLARERLELAPQIAWTKYSRGIPVYDPARETAALQSAMAQGAARGVPPETTRRFFAAQMEASRRIQWQWIEGWRKNLTPPLGAVRSLDGDLRSRIDAIGAEQVDALARGARPLTLDQISVLGARFWPKNSLSTAAHSSPSTPAVTSQR